MCIAYMHILSLMVQVLSEIHLCCMPPQHHCSHSAAPVHSFVHTLSGSSFFCTVYSGIAPGYSQEIGYSVLVIASCIGSSIQLALSKYIDHEENLYVILTLSVLAVPLFSTADLNFGSGRSRHCCRRKHAVVTRDQFEHDSKPNGTAHSKNIYYIEQSMFFQP